MANQAIAAEGSVPTTADTPSSRTANRWWQWLLIYPTLAITLISALPTWIDHYQSARLGVSRQNLAQAEEQNRLWQANFDCAKAQEIQGIKTTRNVEVGAQVCPTGDVLIRLKLPDSEQPKIRWVSARSLEQTAFFGPSAAYAVPAPVGGESQSVVNQRWLRAGLLKQRVRQNSGGCLDIMINTYTGSVVSQSPVACSAAF